MASEFMTGHQRENKQLHFVLLIVCWGISEVIFQYISFMNPYEDCLT